MPNPLFQDIGRNSTIPTDSPIGNVQRMIQQFNQFQNSFRGDPKQTVMQMVNSGRISQDQLNQAQQMARQFQHLFK